VLSEVEGPLLAGKNLVS